MKKLSGAEMVVQSLRDEGMRCIIWLSRRRSIRYL